MNSSATCAVVDKSVFICLVGGGCGDGFIPAGNGSMLVSASSFANDSTTFAGDSQCNAKVSNCESDE